MNWKICLASVAASALVACGGTSDSGSSPPGSLALTATPSGGVIANGVNAVIIHVDGSKQGPISVRTDRGTFLETGAATASNASTPFDVTLVSCNSQLVAGCAGNALVRVSDQSGASNQIQVRFVQVEICTNGLDDDGDGRTDCADTDCDAKVCGANGLACSPASPSVCQCPSGQTHEQPSQCAATTPADNDCDGKSGCSDSDCQGQTCATGTAVSGRPLFGTCKAGGACTCVATEGTKELSCGDGFDNDCDGLIDGQDPDCQGKNGQPGQYCGDQATQPGLTWSDPAATGGVATCSVCAPQRNFGLAQPLETNCADGVDNDCNGHADCGDANCVALQAQCIPSGKTRSDGERCNAAFQCVCQSTGGELLCADGLDNDCDGKIDCADTDCSGRACGPNGKTCSGTTCACPGGQVKETSCNDGQDNDCDGLVDCADPDCQPTTPGGADGKTCVTSAGRVGEKCDSLGRCACPGGQVAETTCDDALDNDCNGHINCDDSSCLTRTCAPHGMTCSTVGPSGCTCPGGTTETCNSKVDDNCDGLVDCLDPVNCANQPCDTVNVTYRCLLTDSSRAYNVATNPYLCRDASQFAITVTPGVSRLAANGTSTSTVVAFLQDVNSHTVVSGGNIAFGTTLGTFQGATAPGTSILASTGVDGKATVTLVSSASSGTAIVSAQYSWNAGANSVTGSATVVMPQLSQITLAKQQYAIMGALGSGYQESNELTFQFTDSTNQSYPAGLSVTLTHTSVGGSFIGPDPAACDLVSKICTVTLLTDSLGQAKIILHSGTQATVTSVAVQATGGGTTVNFTSGNIAIVGAKASGNEISINCTPKNIPALIDTDCTKSNYSFTDATITCTVSLADRFKNKLGVATLVEMRTEAGAAGLPTSTPAYASPPPANLGKATNTVTVTGYSLPADVTPFIGEHSLDHGWDGCGIKTHNPRDGLVTVIAAVSGEEGFVDGSNGCPADGVYSVAGTYPGFPNCLGEYFIDLGEPFVDYNDNGLRDNNEPFIDANGNSAYDGSNGMWDAKTIIWSETRVVYTGYTQAFGVAGDNVASRFFDWPVPSGSAPEPPLGTPQPGFYVQSAQVGPPVVVAMSDAVAVFFTDQNFNLPTSRTTYATAVQAAAKISASFGATPPMPQADMLGMNYTTQFCNWANLTQCFSSCQFPVCYPVTNVGGFGYGAFGAMTITPGSQADGNGVCAYASSTLTTGTVTGRLTLQVCGDSH